MQYQRVSDFRLSWKLSIILNLIAGAVFVVGFYLFFYLYAGFSDDRYCIRLLENSNLWVTYILIFVQVILHEYSHALGYKLSGGKVAYGIKWLCPYCREVSGIYYRTREFIITLTLPLITGTIAGIIAILLFPQFLYYTAVCMLVNISGASGDLMMLAYILLKARKDEYIKDEPYGFSVYRAVKV